MSNITKFTECQLSQEFTKREILKQFGIFSIVQGDNVCQYLLKSVHWQRDVGSVITQCAKFLRQTDNGFGWTYLPTYLPTFTSLTFNQAHLLSRVLTFLLKPCPTQHHTSYLLFLLHTHQVRLKLLHRKQVICDKSQKQASPLGLTKLVNRDPPYLSTKTLFNSTPGLASSQYKIFMSQ